MKKSASEKYRIVQNLRVVIQQSRKMARQINRKIEALAQLNKMKAALKEQLVKICGSK